MKQRRTPWTAWMIVVSALGFSGTLIGSCGEGDDTPTIVPGTDASGGSAGGGAVDASAGGSGGGGSSDAAFMCKATNAMAANGMPSVSGADIQACKASADGGSLPDGAGVGMYATCFNCLCLNCPAEAKTCNGNPFCSAVNGCCRSKCADCPSLVPPKPDGSSDAPASDAPASDAPASDTAAPADADNDGG